MDAHLNTKFKTVSPKPRKSSSLKDIFRVMLGKDEAIENDFNEEANEGNKLSEETDTADERLTKVRETNGVDSLVEDISKNGDIERRRTFLNRIFSKVEAGSLRAAIFNLTALTLGIGCQSIPQQYERMSFVMGIIVFNLCALAAWISLRMMHLASRRAKESEYSKLVSKVLHPKLGVVLNALILFYSLGMFIAYQINIYKLTGSLVYQFSDNLKNQYSTFDDYYHGPWSDTWQKLLIMYGTTAVVIFPTCILPDISKMRFVALLAVVALFYVIILVLVQCPFYVIYYQDHPELNIWENVNWFDISTGFTNKLYFFRGASIIIFAFVGHAGAYPVFESLNNNISRRIKKVINTSLVLQYFLFSILGISGFLTAPVMAPDLIIYRKNYPFASDLAMQIGQIAIIVVLLMIIPVKYNAFRVSFLNMVWGNGNLTWKVNIILTSCTFLLTTFVAFIYDVISNYLSVLGGFGAVAIGFLFPGLLYIYTNVYPKYHWKNVCTFLAITVITLIGVISGIRTLVEIIGGI